MISENEIKGIDSPSSIKSDEVLNVNDIIYTANLASPRIIISKNNKFKKYIIYIIIILLAILGFIIFITYWTNNDFAKCIYNNIFSTKSNFINAIM